VSGIWYASVVAEEIAAEGQVEMSQNSSVISRFWAMSTPKPLELVG